MFRVLFLVLFSVFAVQVTLAQFDFGALVGNRRIVQNQIQCLLDKSPCDRNGRALKSGVKEYLQRNCASCTPQQKQVAQRLSNFAKTNYPKEWNAIVNKYKPRS